MPTTSSPLQAHSLRLEAALQAVLAVAADPEVPLAIRADADVVHADLARTQRRLLSAAYSLDQIQGLAA